MAGLPPLAADCHIAPPAGDGRPPLATVLGAFEALGAAGWSRVAVGAQPAPSGGALPIVAWTSGLEVDAVLIGGIHGREPAGALALARFVPALAGLGRVRGLLVMPLLNPWGYLRHERYGPSGRSVSDSDHLLGRTAAPACSEAAAITDFVANRAGIRPGAAVLDLHEDPVYETADGYLTGVGSYLYFIGEGAPARPESRRVRACLDRSPLPLIRDGVTRFGEQLRDGAVLDSADGSIDELLARRLDCTPVITVENLLHGPDDPPLSVRVAVYLDVLEAFFGK